MDLKVEARLEAAAVAMNEQGHVVVKGGGDVGTGQRARLYCNKGNYVGSEAAKSLAIKKRNKVGTKQNLAFSKLCYVRFRISRIFWDNEGPCLIQVSLQLLHVC